MSGRIVDIEVRELAPSGEGAGTSGGKRVLLHGTMPGDLVRAQVSKDGHGEVLELLRASPSREVPACPHAELCGGCDWQHVPEELQQSTRLGWLRASLSAELRGAVEPRMHSGPALHYRSRCRLRWHSQGGVVRLGYRRAGSHALAAVEQCPVLVEPLERALVVLRDALRGLEHGEASLALGVGGKPVVSLWPGGTPRPEHFALPTELVARGFAGAELWVEGATSAHRAGDPRPVVRASDGEELVLAPAGFSQANEALNAELARCVLAGAAPKGRKVLELFAGAGNFTVGLAREAREVLAVENDASACEALRANLAARGLRNVRVRQEDAMALGRELEGAEVLVLDPPRTGARSVAELLGAAERGPRRVVYVSCSPPTLGRDLSALVSKGRYKLQSLDAVEMFPQTAHLEVVAVLEASSRRPSRW